jgi:hypothetical protein
MNAEDRMRDIVLTSSRLRVWWLVNFCGYRVVRETEEFTESVLGARFVSHWHLIPARQAE